MLSLEYDDEDTLDAPCPEPLKDKPRYPYGTRICLTEKELKKLDLEPDCDVGDVIDMRCFGRVTSKSEDERADGEKCCRIEIQIEEIALEDEMTDRPGED
jgi:hypothetical protein